MAFFTSHLGGATRNDALANMIARKKEKEQESIAKWENHSQYLNNSNVRAMKEKHWTSTQSYDTSMQAFQFQSNDSETEIWLKQRREKLRVILDSELTEQENALKRISDKPKDKTCMILRSTVLKQSREDERTKLAQKLLREQFLNNNHDYKNMVSSAKQKEVVSAWDCQRNELRENSGFTLWASLTRTRQLQYRAWAFVSRSVVIPIVDYLLPRSQAAYSISSIIMSHLEKTGDEWTLATA
ncbi:hypothetical protein AHF37_09189 [Paragonimus kellicotti]|nr:hypothetical protein AHF37_09189 [Paragonimus kellicotti]